MANYVPPPGKNPAPLPNKNQSASGQWRTVPGKLEKLDNGEVAKRIEFVRQKCETLSPEEMYLILNPADIEQTAESQFSQKARWRESLRNAILFLPLIVTWLSFSLASIAFVQSAAVNQNVNGQSFFGLWINGFPDLSYLAIGPLHLSLLVGHWRWFTFTSTAFADFLLLAIIVIVNQFVHVAEGHARQDAIAAGEWVRKELHTLSQESLVQAIGVGPDAKQPKWVVEVNAAINGLTTLLQGVETMMEASQESFDETIKKFNDTYQQQGQFVEGLIENTNSIKVAVDDLHTIYDRADKTYAGLEEILPKLGDQVSRMAQQQDTTTRALEAIARSVHERRDHSRLRA